MIFHSTEELRDFVNSEKVTLYSHESGEYSGVVTIERLTVRERLSQVKIAFLTGAECIKDGFYQDIDAEPIRLDSLYVYDAADYIPVEVGNDFDSVMGFIATDEMQSLNGDNGEEEWETVPDNLELNAIK